MKQIKEIQHFRNSIHKKTRNSTMKNSITSQLPKKNADAVTITIGTIKPKNKFLSPGYANLLSNDLNEITSSR